MMAGALSSCSLFDKTSATKQNSFKHKEPLPKKYIIHHKSREIIK